MHVHATGTHAVFRRSDGAGKRRKLFLLATDCPDRVEAAVRSGVERRLARSQLQSTGDLVELGGVAVDDEDGASVHVISLLCYLRSWSPDVVIVLLHAIDPSDGQEARIECFASEFDAFFQRLQAARSPDAQSEAAASIVDDKPLLDSLSRWHEVVVLAMLRARDHLAACLPGLVYAVLCGKAVRFVGADDDLVAASHSFVAALRGAAGVRADVEDGSDAPVCLDLSAPTDAWPDMPSNAFTARAAQLICQAGGAVAAREVVQACGERVAMSFAELEKLLLPEKLDQYSLFRAVHQLSQSDNQSVLLCRLTSFGSVAGLRLVDLLSDRLKELHCFGTDTVSDTGVAAASAAL